MPADSGGENRPNRGENRAIRGESRAIRSGKRTLAARAGSVRPAAGRTRGGGPGVGNKRLRRPPPRRFQDPHAPLGQIGPSFNPSPRPPEPPPPLPMTQPATPVSLLTGDQRAQSGQVGRGRSMM